MELSLLLLVAFGKWGVSPLLVPAIVVEVQTPTLCNPSYSGFKQLPVSFIEFDCLSGHGQGQG